jgi:transglutaminase-like putative cysteine protease
MASKFFTIVLFTIFTVSCVKRGPLIQNPERLADIERMLTVQKELTSKSLLPIWDILKQPLSKSEEQGLKFLYAYMPLSDLADYKPDFFLKNVQLSLRARQDMSWGSSIPEEEFLHFVLPVRVNNENLDNFREIMYPEIKSRIKGLSMREAALEINHWCHEKVNYRGTDSRTSAPLGTVKKSFGRCGEESTFTVAAMRTAGIPARQVYTPRWAHSDDNHAWVEVWIDGKWNYLGACEPDVDLNMGWFSGPATRAMLVHTRAYGHYFGKENVITDEERFSELNLTSNYAKVKKITVLVMDEDGKPANNAKVEYQLYNYAEYYPISTGYTNNSGITSLITGLGDLIIRTYKNGKSAFKKFSVPQQDTLKLILNQNTPAIISESFDLVPPHDTKIMVKVTSEAREKNNRRLTTEDSIRRAYVKSFKDSAWIYGFAKKTKLPIDTISRFIRLSYGNWDQVTAYLEKNTPDYRNLVLELPLQLSDKDFSDAPENILTDHLVQTAKLDYGKSVTSKELFTRYVLSPRIGFENLSPWRSFLSTAFGPEMVKMARNDISALTSWIRGNIRIDEVANMHSRTPLTPVGVYNMRAADPVSRDIFFVAACRTFGIPSRLNPETQVPEYYKHGMWCSSDFDPGVLIQPEKGSLKLLDKNNPIAPQYYLHYTIGVLRNGFYRTLEFPEGKKLSNTDGPIPLNEGNYALVTGNRLQDGLVLSRMVPFSIEKGKLTVLPVEVRKQPGELKPSGRLDPEQLIIKRISDGKSIKLSSLASGKPRVLVVLDPGQEPSKHILNDLGPYVDHFNKWGGQFVFIMPLEKAGQADVLKSYNLPVRMESGIDKNWNILNAISAVYGDGLKDKLPLVLLCDGPGNVYLFSSGYKIGVGEQLLKVISAF